MAELVHVEDADDIYSQVMYDNSRVLSSVLPTTNTRTYNLRQRPHNRTLVVKTIITRERFHSQNKGLYWLLSVAVLGRGRGGGGSAPALFFQAHSFSTDYVL